MNKIIRVLITGIGGDLGQALVKALKLSVHQISCYGCDINPNSIGSAFCKSFHIVPIASDPNYQDALSELCVRLAIDAVIPSTEQEIQVLCRTGKPPRLPSGTPVVCLDADFIETYGDKLACMQALQDKIDLVPFADGEDPEAVAELVEKSGFPLVIKGRHSWGSHQRLIANNNTELRNALSAIPLGLVQAFIDDTNGEYSAGVYSNQEFSSALVFRREMGPTGNSWFAETSNDESVIKYVTEIARTIALEGSVNIQVRKNAEGVKLLEINTRFSSLVAARAASGFRDAEWSLEIALGLGLSIPKHAYKTIRFHRYFHELIDFGNGYHALQEWYPDSAPEEPQETS